MNPLTDPAVLVTGGQGFLGQAVRKLLRSSGQRVVVLDEASPADHEHACGYVQCDITDLEPLKQMFEARPILGIIHLAAMLPTAAQREPTRATRVNLIGSLNLLEMARQFGVRRFVFGSSVSVYGTCPERVVSEDDRATPEDLYGAAKLYVEQLGSAYRERLGMEFVSLRIGRVVGPGARSSTSAWRSQIFELLRTTEAAEIALPYVGDERILLVHVDEVAKMLATLLGASSLRHALYNAPCESIVVGELKREVESLNPKIKVRLGSDRATGNPRLLDSSRFAREFGLEMAPIFEQLRRATAH
ncbi:MAG TPA: NAD(P)-dependent oxidoreductase [Verrucomicrobiae bacterium]|nr:NAD(P)-dependent oxidoreductase [Verrucomicrobiae bacterium]